MTAWDPLLERQRERMSDRSGKGKVTVKREIGKKRRAKKRQAGEKRDRNSDGKKIQREKEQGKEGKEGQTNIAK